MNSEYIVSSVLEVGAAKALILEIKGGSLTDEGVANRFYDTDE